MSTAQAAAFATPLSTNPKKATRRRSTTTPSAESETNTQYSQSPTPPPPNDDPPTTKRKVDAALQTDPCDEPDAKRAKSTLAASMHPIFWNLDGNIIVQIEQMRFKLHRSWLVKHSTFFQAVFEGTYDGDRARLENVDGNTVCHVTGTTTEDFAELLGALDKAITFYYTDPPFAVMARILRASTSLEFPDFRTWVVRHFEEYWSDDLNNLTDERLENVTETIALAREYNVPGILKRAFYELLRTASFGQPIIGDSEYEEGEGSGDEEDDDDSGSNSDEEEDDSGSSSEEDEDEEKCSSCEGDGDGDGESGDEEEAAMNDMSDNASESTLEPTVDVKDDRPIAPDDMLRLLNAREQLTAAWILAAASVPTRFSCSCMSPTQWTRVVHTSGIFKDNLYDPICGFNALVKIDWASERIHDECIAIMVKGWGKQRQKLWDDLDLWLEL